MKVVVAITGASGSIYSYRLVEYLNSNDGISEIYLLASSTGKAVFKYEMDLDIFSFEKFSKVKFIDSEDFFAPISSGSYKVDAMVIIPCSMSTLAAVSCGINRNLIHRAAEVFLKERRKIVFVVREMPFSEIHIENMKKVTLSGGIVISASPSFYSKPESVEELVDTVIFKVMDLIGLDIGDKYRRWNGSENR